MCYWFLEPLLMRLFQFCIAFVVLANMTNAVAQETRLDGAIESKLEHNTNYRFTSGPHDSIEVLSLKPSLSLSRNTESASTSATASVTSYKLTGSEASDRNDMNLMLSTVLKMDRDSFQFSAGYLKDSTLSTELKLTGIPLSLQDRKSLSLSGSWIHDLTERMKNSFSVSFAQVNYSGSLSTSDYRYYVVSDSLQYALNESDIVSGTFSQSYYDLANNSLKSDTTNLTLGWDHTFDEWMTMNLQVGRFVSDNKRTQSICPSNHNEVLNGYFVCDIPLEKKEETSKSYGSILNGSLDYKWNETLGYQLAYSRTLNPSGANALLLTDNYRFSMNKQLDTNLSLGFGISKLESSYIGLSGAAPTKFLSTSLNLNWQAFETVNVESGLRLQKRENGPSQNVFYVQLRKNWNEIRSFR